MKPIVKFLAVLLLLAQFGCGKQYTCNCNQVRYEYNTAGTDSTLLISNIITGKKAYTKHKAEQKCFSEFAKEREVFISSPVTKVVTTTTCVVY